MHACVVVHGVEENNSLATPHKAVRRKQLDYNSLSHPVVRTNVLLLLPPHTCAVCLGTGPVCGSHCTLQPISDLHAAVCVMLSSCAAGDWHY